MTTPAPGSPGAPLWDPAAIPAATIIPLRDGASGLEILMLRRDKDLKFAGGMWVFPGGRLDPEDYPNGIPPDECTPEQLEDAARTAALREADEEAGLVLEPATIRRWTHWTPPPRAPAEGLTAHRFTTAFYVGVAIGDTDAISIDDGEIRAHEWVGATDMLDRHAQGEVQLAPPTYITLCQLTPYRNPAEVLLATPRDLEGVEHFATRVGTIGEDWVALYHGDVAYEGGPLDTEGPRHRLHMSGQWRYERDEAS
jgi:8-oxo-dGTP pyrophosphatase MutT (NUDIX family)